MANKTVDTLRKKTDAAWDNLSRQLQGMEPHLDRADAPGQWTTREVLCHLLAQPGSQTADLLKTFKDRDYRVVDFKPGEVNMTPDRKTMSLKRLVDALDADRRGAYQYLDSLPEAELETRKLRIPIFKQFMGTEDVSLAMFAGAMFDYHWNDHAGQIGKIRKAAGLPEAR